MIDPLLWGGSLLNSKNGKKVVFYIFSLMWYFSEKITFNPMNLGRPKILNVHMVL